jgi:hypothetical protein
MYYVNYTCLIKYFLRKMIFVASVEVFLACIAKNKSSRLAQFVLPLMASDGEFSLPSISWSFNQRTRKEKKNMYNNKKINQENMTLTNSID